MYLLTFQNPDVSVLVCIAKTLELLELEERHAEGVDYLRRATALGSAYGAYLLWRQRHKQMVSFNICAIIQLTRSPIKVKTNP